MNRRAQIIASTISVFFIIIVAVFAVAATRRPTITADQPVELQRSVEAFTSPADGGTLKVGDSLNLTVYLDPRGRAVESWVLTLEYSKSFTYGAYTGSADVSVDEAARAITLRSAQPLSALTDLGVISFKAREAGAATVDFSADRPNAVVIQGQQITPNTTGTTAVVQ